MKDLIDDLHNLVAAMFQIRPWDLTPLIILRVTHEMGCFSGCTNSNEHQLQVTEGFINEQVVERGRNWK